MKEAHHCDIARLGRQGDVEIGPAQSQSSRCQSEQELRSGATTLSVCRSYNPADQAPQLAAVRCSVGQIHLEGMCRAQDARLDDIIVEAAEILWGEDRLLEPVALDRRPLSAMGVRPQLLEYRGDRDINIGLAVRALGNPVGPKHKAWLQIERAADRVGQKNIVAQRLRSLAQPGDARTDGRLQAGRDKRSDIGIYQQSEFGRPRIMLARQRQDHPLHFDHLIGIGIDGLDKCLPQRFSPRLSSRFGKSCQIEQRRVRCDAAQITADIEQASSTLDDKSRNHDRRLGLRRYAVQFLASDHLRRCRREACDLIGKTFRRFVHRDHMAKTCWQGPAQDVVETLLELGMGEQRIWLDIELAWLVAHRPAKPDREQSAAGISLHERGQSHRRIFLGDQQRILLWSGEFELVSLQLNRMRSRAAHLAAIRPLDGRQGYHAFGVLARIVAQIAHDVRAAMIGAEKEDIALVNAVIGVIAEHQWKLKESAAISVAEFYTIGVDNMVRNLAAGRRKNFPGQLD